VSYFTSWDGGREHYLDRPPKEGKKKKNFSRLWSMYLDLVLDVIEGSQACACVPSSLTKDLS
jgi:hypothetical protein